MTPFEITILIHYHTRPGAWRGEGYGSPIYEETMSRLAKCGLLAYDVVNDEYVGGPALSTYMQAVQELPSPVQAWVMP